MFTKVKDWKIRDKLFAGIALIFLLFIIVGSYTFFPAALIQKKSLEAEVKDFTAVTLSTSLKETALKISCDYGDIFVRQSPQFLKDVEIQREKFFILLSGLKKLLVNNPQNIRRLERIENSFNEYYEVGKNMIQVYVSGNIETAKKMKLDLLYTIDRILEKYLDELESEYISRLSLSLSKIEDIARNARNINILLLVLALILIMIIFFRLAAIIVAPINKLAEGTQQIAKGDFSYRMSPETNDEVGQLAKAFNKMTEDLQTTTTSLNKLNKEILEREKTEKLMRKVNRALRMISECNQILVRTMEEEIFLRKICNIIVETGEYAMAWIGLKENDKEKTIQSVIFAGKEAGYLSAVKFNWAGGSYSADPLGNAIRSGKTCVVEDIHAAEYQVENWAKEADKRGYKSLIILPLQTEGEVLGTLNIYAKEINAFDPEETGLIEELANNLAYGIVTLRTRKAWKKAEDDREKSFSLLHATLESTTDGILVVNNAGEIVNFNQKFVSMWHLPESVLKTKDDNQALQFVLPQLKRPEEFLQRIKELNRQQDAESYDIIEFKDGRVFERYSQPQRIEGKSVGRVWSFRDVTQRRRTVEEIRRGYQIQTTLNTLLNISLQNISLQEMLEKIINSITSIPWLAFEAKGAIFLAENDPGVLVMKAQRGLNKTNLSDCSRVPFGRCLCGQAALKAGIIFSEDINEHHETCYEGMTAHGHYCVPLLTSNNKVCGVFTLYVNKNHQRTETEEKFLNAVGNVITGIVERKQAEEALQAAYSELKSTQAQLIQAEKMQVVGGLASGVAHEVKNPLAIILQGVDYFTKKVDAGDKNIAMVLHHMTDAVERADSIIKGLLDFSSLSALNRKRQNLNSVIETALLLVKYELDSYHITAIKDFREDIPEVEIDKNKIEQMFVNLFLNAAHAMSDAGKQTAPGGNLTIRTYAKNLLETEKGINPQKAVVSDNHLLQNIAVVVEIEDTGPGIPEDVLGKIFDPFFTTRRGSGGTGLGLSIVRNIVKMHNAQIEINNKKGGSGVIARITFKT